MAKTEASRAERWEQRYQTGDLPWDSPAPEPELFRRLEQIGLAAGRAIELGCGTGTNCIALAERGFDVAGYDISPMAIDLARRKAADARRDGIRFQVVDLLEGLPDADGSADLVFDRGCFHSVDGFARELFASRVAHVLRPGGWWIMLAGNRDDDPSYEVAGPPQVAAADIARITEPLFEVHDLARVRLTRDGRPSHLFWSALLRRRPATGPRG